jgi:hypothetical protein
MMNHHQLLDKWHHSNMDYMNKHLCRLKENFHYLLTTIGWGIF